MRFRVELPDMTFKDREKHCGTLGAAVQTARDYLAECPPGAAAFVIENVPTLRLKLKRTENGIEETPATSPAVAIAPAPRPGGAQSTELGTPPAGPARPADSTPLPPAA